MCHWVSMAAAVTATIQPVLVVMVYVTVIKLATFSVTVVMTLTKSDAMLVSLTMKMQREFAVRNKAKLQENLKP